MKANELMIGDWVIAQPDEDICGEGVGTIVDRITEIYDVEGVISVSLEDFNYPVAVGLLEPFRLTPEILEKNGFTHSFGDSDFYDYERWEKKVDDKTIRVIKDNDGWFCRVDDIKLTRSMGIAPSVHTMQHIIRIGGIDKTIEL